MPPSRQRRPALGLAFGLGLLLTIELLTRLVAGAPRPALFAAVPEASTTLTRRSNGRLVLPYQGDLTDGPVSLSPPADRPRVVWLGGSSIRGGNPGMPLDREAARIAGRRLDVDTVNLAGPGLDSAHHLALLPDVLALSPDAVVVYAGHNDLGNEVLMARYSGDAFRRVAATRWALRHSRLFSLVEEAVRQRAVLRLPDRSMRARHRVDAALRTDIREGFRARLGALVAALRDAGVTVVLATPASNPAVPSLEWECPAALARLGLQGRPPEAFPVAHLDRSEVEALLAEGDCFDLRWLLARLDQDREALDALRDQDPLPFRASRAMVADVRALAAAHGAVLADSNTRFRALGQGIEPPALFDDPMHLSETGHQVLGAVVAEALAGPLGRPLPPSPSARLPSMDLAACGDLPCRVAPPPPPR